MAKTKMPFELTLEGLGTKPGVSLDIQITATRPQGMYREKSPDLRGMQEWICSRIWVERNDNPAEVRSTLLHEVIHAALTSENILDDLNMSPEQEETLVEGLERFISDYFEKPEVQALYKVKANKEQ